MIIKSIMAILIGFIIAVIFGYFLIPLLKKLHAGQNISIYLSRSHSKKQGTPTMGGLIFIVPTILVILLLIFL